jgi:anti-sigma factor RsiW
MRCQEFREMTDSYLSDELLIETNHDVLRHLESCAACLSEFAARRELRARVRSAVKNSPETQINHAFAARLQTNLRAAALERPTVWEKIKVAEFFNPKVLAFAASLLVIALVGTIWLSRSSSNETTIAENNQSNRAGEIPNPAESPIVEVVRAAWQQLTGEAVGDHKNCALHFRLEEEPITLAKAAEKYGKYNRDLDKTVAASLNEIFAEKQTVEAADKVQFYEAHSCVFQGKRFAHVILLYRNRRISVLVTEADLPDAGDGEIFSEANEGMLVARFRTACHAVFVVSDLSATENVRIAQKLSPAIRLHIERAESGV